MWFLPIALLLAIPQTPALPLPLPCSIDAWLDSPGGPIAFRLDVRAPRGKGGSPTFALLNGVRGEDLIWIERWETQADALLFHIDSYDSHLELRAGEAKGSFDGRWRKLRGASEWVEMPLHGTVRGPDARSPVAAPTPGLDGRWAVEFSSSTDPAVGVFDTPEAGRLAGTFLTTLGDYRYLAGGFDEASSSWRLSCFDGAHAFLFTAKQQSDGTLRGDFWSGDKWHETWTAKRYDNAQLPDPFGLTKSTAAIDLSKLVLPGIDGARVSLADPKFAGNARILQLFGTWCPNCNDEAEYLRELDRRYRGRGLSIVGLAFELTGDEARDLGQLKLFAARHRVEYPLLLAGKSDKAQASKAFPLLDQVRAYPTTVFLDAAGHVRAVHQGYCGPATGPEHQKLRQDFERLIDELLAR